MFGKAPRLAPPRLTRGFFTPAEGGEPLAIWTDETLFERARVRVAFPERSGGASMGPYASLNLAAHVDDDAAAVSENRQRLLSALGLSGMPLVVPKQVHGDRVLALKKASAQAVDDFRAEAGKGADALLVPVRGVAALLCFADCVPLVIVAPSGRFAVVHAGWRGVENGIAAKALHQLMLGEPGLAVDASCVNVYRGAYIRSECFEVDEELHDLFTSRYGDEIAPDGTHLDLGRALDADLVRAGVSPERIAEVGECTVCANDRWFSYRAAHGRPCGRHGALCAALAR